MTAVEQPDFLSCDDPWFRPADLQLAADGSIYVCGDWRSSSAIHRVLQRHFAVRNRISWEREKGRGAKTNWKNNTEDIWFATMSNDYAFNVDDVKVKRRVIAWAMGIERALARLQ